MRQLGGAWGARGVSVIAIARLALGSLQACASGDDEFVILVEPAAAGFGGAGEDDSGTAGAGGVDSGTAAGFGGTGWAGGGFGGAGAAGSGGSAGTGVAGMAGSGGSGGLVCDQTDWEPNNEQSRARDLGSMSDCDKTGIAIEGTLAGDDEDWFTIKTDDKLTCTVNPEVDVTSLENVTVCIYFDCDHGRADVGCPWAASEKQAPGGQPGCCSSSSPFSPDLNCKGSLDEAGRVWVQVKWPGNSSCKPYSVETHF